MFIDESSKPKEKLKAWYLFTEDFIAGTQHMTNEALGIYIRLLCWNWNKRCKGIPNEENLIFRVAMAFNEQEKKTCLDVLSENFNLINESHWQNERQLQEYLYNPTITPLPLPLPLPLLKPYIQRSSIMYGEDYTTKEAVSLEHTSNIK